jgi:dolichol kinase
MSAFLVLLLLAESTNARPFWTARRILSQHDNSRKRNTMNHQDPLSSMSNPKNRRGGARSSDASTTAKRDGGTEDLVQAEKQQLSAEPVRKSQDESTSTSKRPESTQKPTATALASSDKKPTTNKKTDPTDVVATTSSVKTKNNRRRRRRFGFHRRDTNKRHYQIAKTLKNRNHTNVRRKLMHAAFGLAFAGLNHAVPRTTFVPCMAVLSTATLIMELLRYRPRFAWMNDWLHSCLGSSLRNHEMTGKFTGSFYFFAGVTLTSYLYDTPAACMGMAQLALADPSASYFGRHTRHVYWSRIENGLYGVGRNKGILGFLGGALFCVPFNYRVVRLAKCAGAAGLVQLTNSQVLAVSLLLGLAGAFADLLVPTPALVLPKRILGIRVPPLHVDDNFVVPIFSGFAAMKVFKAFGIESMELARYIVM